MEPGESDGGAVVREVLEETGLHVTVGIRVGTVVRDGPDGSAYDIRDYACAVTGPASPVAGDDADEARWVTRAELADLDLVEHLWDTLAGWGMLPR